MHSPALGIVGRVTHREMNMSPNSSKIHDSVLDHFACFDSIADSKHSYANEFPLSPFSAQPSHAFL